MRVPFSIKFFEGFKKCVYKGFRLGILRVLRLEMQVFGLGISDVAVSANCVVDSKN